MNKNEVLRSLGDMQNALDRLVVTSIASARNVVAINNDLVRVAQAVQGWPEREEEGHGAIAEDGTCSGAE